MRVISKFEMSQKYVWSCKWKKGLGQGSFSISYFGSIWESGAAMLWLGVTYGIVQSAIRLLYLAGTISTDIKGRTAGRGWYIHYLKNPAWWWPAGHWPKCLFWGVSGTRWHRRRLPPRLYKSNLDNRTCFQTVCAGFCGAVADFYPQAPLKRMELVCKAGNGTVGGRVAVSGHRRPRWIKINTSQEFFTPFSASEK